MKLAWQRAKLYLAMICIGLMAFLTGVPMVSEEKVEQIIQASNHNNVAEEIQAEDEQS